MPRKSNHFPSVKSAEGIWRLSLIDTGGRREGVESVTSGGAWEGKPESAKVEGIMEERSVQVFGNED